MGLGALGAVILGGHFAGPTLMEPPIDLATPRGLSADDLPAGAGALEAAFWLTALLASVLNFRVLELLFRRRDVLALQTLPIEPAALFLDRFIATIMEALVTASVASLFFVPLIWHGSPAAFFASATMVFGGLILGAMISLVVMILSTQYLIPEEEESRKTRVIGADPYGGTGQILLYAPALSLGSIVVAALFWKLLLGEPLRLGYLSEPFWIGSAVLTAVALACVILAYRAFVANYYAMAPRFHEADAAEFTALVAYQSSSFQKVRAWEWGLDRHSASTYRALILDDDRRVAGGRIGYALVLILAIIGLATLELAALPAWAVAMVPAILIATIVNPWHRLFVRVNLLHDPLALPLSAGHRQIAAARGAMREFLFMAGPYSLAVALILGYFRGLGSAGLLIALLALLSGPGLAGGVSIFRRFGLPASSLRWLPSALLIALTICAIYSLAAAIVVSLAVALTAFLLFRASEPSHVTA